MPDEPVVAVVFEGGRDMSRIEEIMSGIRKEATLDGCEKLLGVPEIDDVVLCTNYPDLASRAADMGVTVEYRGLDDGFHFGLRLREVVEKRRINNVIYSGGVAAPLIEAEELSWLATTLKTHENVVIMNNVQSADLVGFTPGHVLSQVDLPATDNFLGWTLREAGLRRILIPNSGRVNFDIDTPTDIMILSLQPGLGYRTRHALQALEWNMSTLQAGVRLLAQRSTEILIAGRVGPTLIAHINMNFSHRVRVISEERGMKALGRDERGEVVSLLGYLFELAGPERLVEMLESMCQVAFIDTRVLFHHLKKDLSDHDRFNSDLGNWEVISDSDIRQLTRACQGASIPIILGGHSLVSGGLWLIADSVLASRNGDK